MSLHRQLALSLPVAVLMGAGSLCPRVAFGHGDEAHAPPQERDPDANVDSMEVIPIAPSERVAAIAVQFKDTDVAPYPIEEVRNVMDRVEEYFREASYGKVNLSAEVFGWITMNQKPTCDKAKLKKGANHAALKHGVPLEEFTRIVYFGPAKDCGFGGFGRMSRENVTVRTHQGRPDKKIKATVAYISHARPSTIVHEMGHNAGLFHASSLDCDSPPMGEPCRDNEYFDHFDGMGGYKAAHYNVYSKRKLGWIDPSQVSQIPSIPGKYHYRLTPLETADGLKGLEFPLVFQGKRAMGYVEFRQPIGFDKGFWRSGQVGWKNEVYQGAQFRVLLKSKHQSFKVLHTHVLSMSREALVLRPGESYRFDSPGEEMTFKTVEVENGALEMEVTVGPEMEDPPVASTPNDESYYNQGSTP